MNTKLIWILVALVGAGVFVVLWYATSLPDITLPPSGWSYATTTPGVNGSNNGGTAPVGTTSSPSGTELTLADQNGTAVAVRDFIHNGVTIPDASNTGRYVLAGEPGYCSSGADTCPVASSTNFNIYYNSGAQSFTIALTKEPIGQARLEMEQFLLGALGITQEQLCKLNYLVGVTRYVNPQFTGKNLGFSFCPGATLLPN